MEAKNNNQVPQEQAVHLIKSALDIFRDEIFRLQCELDKLKQQPNEDYTHLLPEGYEFCTEEQAEKWVKVDLIKPVFKQKNIGTTTCTRPSDHFKPVYRPIRKIQVHEVVTAEPNLYQVDWSNAPEWADVHAFDKDGSGWWHGCIISNNTYRHQCSYSNFTLPTGLDWKQSKTVRPK